MTDHKLTVQQYRQKWELPTSYPSGGRTQLCEGAICSGEEDRAWSKGGSAEEGWENGSQEGGNTVEVIECRSPSSLPHYQRQSG
jgi:hypothetical protein